MKLVQKFILPAFVCLFCVTAIAAQQSDAPAVKKIYKNVRVEKFTIKQGVEFPAEGVDKIAQNMVNSLTKSKRFERVALAVEQTAPAAAQTTAQTTAPAAATTDSDVPTLRLSGEIVFYNKGSQGGRYLNGPFGGQKYATRVAATVRFVDVETGEIVLEQTADGVVSGGFFGGGKDGATDGLSDEVVRIVKNNFSEKKK